MIDNAQLLEKEKSIINIDAILDFFLRRRKIIVISSTLLFLILFFNTIYNYVKKPIYQGSFSILINDPIDDKKPSLNSFEAGPTLNQFSYKIPTLIQYLRSEYVLNPLAKEFGISKQALKKKINIKLDGERPFVSRGILKVTLKDSNKLRNSLIMNKLSQRYLEAAGEQRKLKLNSGLDFLNSELPLVEAKNNLVKKKIEAFRTKYNIVNPLNEAKNIEKQKLDISLQISEFSSNLRRLNLIKKEINSNQFKINGFVEELSSLGFKIIGSDLEFINQYIVLEGQLAEAKTKYKPKSKVLSGLEKRLESLYSEIQEKQLASIELAMKLNQSKIELEEKKLKITGKENPYGN